MQILTVGIEEIWIKLSSFKTNEWIIMRSEIKRNEKFPWDLKKWKVVINYAKLRSRNRKFESSQHGINRLGWDVAICNWEWVNGEYKRAQWMRRRSRTSIRWEKLISIFLHLNDVRKENSQIITIGKTYFWLLHVYNSRCCMIIEREIWTIIKNRNI